MKKFRNLLVALLLVGAMTIPTLAAKGGISANPEQVDKLNEAVLQSLGLSSAWQGETITYEETVVRADVEQLHKDDAEANGINVVAAFDVEVFVKNSKGELSDAITTFPDVDDKGTGYNVVVEVPADAFPELEEGYTRSYHVLRYHENESVVVLDATYNSADSTVSFSSNLFSTFVVGYTDTKIEQVEPETPVQPQKPAQPEAAPSKPVVNPAPAYDDGGPFTHDECGNVYDRWGNEIWHAPVCAANASNGGYSLVNTADR